MNEKEHILSILSAAAEYLKDDPRVSYTPWPEYDARVYAVLNTMSDIDYLENHGRIAGKDIGTMTLEDIATMYTFISRGERFCDGHIASYIEDGTLYRLIRRHIELLDMQ